MKIIFLDTETGPQRYQRCCCSFWGCCYQIFNVLRLFHFTTDRQRRIQIGGNIIYNRTVSDFQIKSKLINNN